MSISIKIKISKCSRIIYSWFWFYWLEVHCSVLGCVNLASTEYLAEINLFFPLFTKQPSCWACSSALTRRTFSWIHCCAIVWILCIYRDLRYFSDRHQILIFTALLQRYPLFLFSQAVGIWLLRALHSRALQSWLQLFLAPARFPLSTINHCHEF